MKALTIKAPFAQAIVHGPKRIENRTWKPHEDVMGERIAIHCGKSMAKPGDYDDTAAIEQLDEAHAYCVGEGATEAGCIIGTARVVGVAHRDTTDDREAHGGVIPGVAEVEYFCRSQWNITDQTGTAPYEVRIPEHPWDNPWWLGPIGWLLDDVRQVEPVEARGMPGLWRVPDEIELVEVAQ